MRRAGFTIVELLIVIVVIAILAAITIVAYNGIQQRAQTSSLKSEISNAAKQMELAKADTDTYPTTLPSAFKVSSNVTLSLSQTTSGFCVNGEHLQNSSIRWRYESANGGLQEGLCSGAVIAGTETGMNQNLANDLNFTQLTTTAGNWYLARGGITSVAGTTRSGNSADPLPSRPVLQIVNTANSSATWSFLTGPINISGIISGKSYLVKFYVRLATGSYAGTVNHFGVMSHSATNSSIPQTTSSITPTSSWQPITRTVTATQNGISGTYLYAGISLTDVKTNNFTLELQGFELREQ